MEISESDIRLIIRLIAEKLGPDAPAEKMSSLAADVIRHLSDKALYDTPENTQVNAPARKMIVNAFGPNTGGLDQNLRYYLSEKSLPLIDISLLDINKYKSLLVIIDYSQYQGDINRLKLELSEICEKYGFKAVIQDSEYFGQ